MAQHERIIVNGHERIIVNGIEIIGCPKYPELSAPIMTPPQPYCPVCGELIERQSQEAK